MDSGLLFPEKDWPPVGWREMTAVDWEEWRSKWGAKIGYQWLYQGHLQKILWEQMPYKVFELLGDETGFLVIPEFDYSTEAKILNGDLSVRCVMKPVFNVRGLAGERLEAAKKAQMSYYNGRWNPEPHFKRQVRNRDRTDGVIEIEGNDGFADCMYFFDTQTGAFVGAEPYAWTD